MDHENMNAQCVFVLGVEASGTRLLKSIFLHNGYYGSPDHDEIFGASVSEYRPPNPVDHPKIVWRFSYPMGAENPRADVAAKLAEQAGYGIVTLVIVRDGFCAGPHNVPDRACRDDSDQVFHLHQLLAHVISMPVHPTRILTYESLCQHGLKVFQGLPFELLSMPNVLDGNLKWYP